MVSSNKVVIVRGVSGSGKSTWSAEYRRTHPDENVIVVNRDKIRELLFGSEEAHGIDEFLVTQVQDKTILSALWAKRPYTVIVDNTNIEWKFVQALKRLAQFGGAVVELKVIDEPLEVCLARNAARNRQVPEQVIRNQWTKFQETKDWTL